MIIYKITNLLNQKFYIGKTSKTVEERFIGHCYDVKYGSQTHFHKAIRKFGKENFKLEIIEETDNADEREIFWISELNPEYNSTKGGEGGDTSKTKNYQKWLLDVRVNGLNRGANSHLFGQPPENHPGFGKKRSQEQRDKLRKALKDKWDLNDSRKKLLSEKMKEDNPGAKKLSKRVKVNGIEYDSISEASRILNISTYQVKKIGALVNG